MSLAIGDHVVKLDRNTGKPVDPQDELHVEFEVIELLGYSYSGGEVKQDVKLRTVR